MSSPPPDARRSEVRDHIVEVADRLLREEGPQAVTTRGVAQAAGVQAPTLYRLFGDKEGLLDAVAEHAMATYVAAKSERVALDDPLADLRAGFEMHVDFGLENPALFALLNAPTADRSSPAEAAGIEVLRARVHRLARSGLLRVTEARAVQVVHAAGTGAVLALLQTPPEARDPGLGEAMFEAAASVILARGPVGADEDVAATAVRLRARAPELVALSEPERRLLVEWLDRCAAGG